MNCPIDLVDYYTVVWSCLRSRDDLCSNQQPIKIYKGFYLHKHFSEDTKVEIYTPNKPKVTDWNDLGYIMALSSYINTLFEIDCMEDKGETTSVLYPSSIEPVMP